MQKMKIKLNRSEQEALLRILLNYDVSVVTSVMERQMIIHLAGDVTRRLATHVSDNLEAKPWMLKLNRGEAAALWAIFWHVDYVGYAATLSQKILYAIHNYFTNIEMQARFVAAQNKQLT